MRLLLLIDLFLLFFLFWFQLQVVGYGSFLRRSGGGSLVEMDFCLGFDFDVGKVFREHYSKAIQYGTHVVVFEPGRELKYERVQDDLLPQTVPIEVVDFDVAFFEAEILDLECG